MGSAPSSAPKRFKAKKYTSDEERRAAIREGQRRRYWLNRESELARFKERDARLRAADPLKFRKRNWRKNGNPTRVFRMWRWQCQRRSQAQLLAVAAVDAYEAWFDSLDVDL